MKKNFSQFTVGNCNGCSIEISDCSIRVYRWKVGWAMAYISPSLAMAWCKWSPVKITHNFWTSKGLWNRKNNTKKNIMNNQAFFGILPVLNNGFFSSSWEHGWPTMMKRNSKITIFASSLFSKVSFFKRDFQKKFIQVPNN